MKTNLLVTALLAGQSILAQNVGIGTSTPTQKLDVNGRVKANGLQMPTGASAGRILKTDRNGVASWGSIDAAGLFTTVPAVVLSCQVLVGSVATGSRPYSIAVAGNYVYARIKTIAGDFEDGLNVVKK